MAEVKMPLMSAGASGKFGDEIVFYERNGKHIARKHVRKIRDSPGSRQNRNIFKRAIELSRQLTPLDRQAWNQMTAGLSFNGHNLFMKKAMDALYGGDDFKPVSINNYFLGDNSTQDGSLLLDVSFTGEPDSEFFLLLGEGSFNDWAGGDVIDGKGDYRELLKYFIVETGETGSGGFIIDDLKADREYWFRLVEVDGRGLSAVFRIELER